MENVGSAKPMTLPQAAQARSFYRAAKQRYLDAQYLLEGARNTGAIYLAGYSVECMLKALIIERTPESKREDLVSSFRGAKAHDYDWLKKLYYQNKGDLFPKEISRAFSIVNTWGVEVRYLPGMIGYGEAELFLDSVQNILTWAEGRM